MPAKRMQYDFQQPVTIPLSDEERENGQMSLENVGKAVAAMHRDGLVVLANAVDLDHVDTLNSILAPEAEAMAKLPTTHFNNNSIDGRPTGNMSQGPPLSPDLMYEDIWANGPAAQVLSSVLGPRPRVNYVNGNTALGGFNGSRQRVHADLTFNHGTFPFGIVTNYYLIDVGPNSGSTELWLGSHRDTTFEDHRNCYADVANNLKAVEYNFGIREELLEERRAWAPPIQPVVKKGSVVLRDLRLWHAGIANPTANARIMLAFVHTPWWYQCPAKVVLPEAARPEVERWASRDESPIDYEAHFVPADLDHKAVKFNPNFTSANKGFKEMLPNLPMGFVFDETDEDGQGKNVMA